MLVGRLHAPLCLRCRECCAFLSCSCACLLLIVSNMSHGSRWRGLNLPHGSSGGDKDEVETLLDGAGELLVHGKVARMHETDLRG